MSEETSVAPQVLNVMKDHADANTTVWNLAAPLSVETAMNPEIAQAVTVGGMKNVLDAMARRRRGGITRAAAAPRVVAVPSGAGRGDAAAATTRIFRARADFS